MKILFGELYETINIFHRSAISKILNFDAVTNMDQNIKWNVELMSKYQRETATKRSLPLFKGLYFLKRARPQALNA